MGWLGYTEQETLNTSMPALLAGIKGKKALIRSIFGGEEDLTPEQQELKQEQGVRALGGALHTLAMKNRKRRGKADE